MTVIPFVKSPKADNLNIVPDAVAIGKQTPVAFHTGSQTAIVYCEQNFGLIDGKTANGLVRHSEKYQILSVIDSYHAGKDSGVILDNEPNHIPIFPSLAAAFSNASVKPDYLIYGMAPAAGMLSPDERLVILEAMRLGMGIVNGLHEFLNDDPEFSAASLAHDVEILDIRRPRQKNELRLFTGKIHNLTCPRIAVMGTDCAIGKRTTANILTSALVERGINAVLVTTGQTGMIQGSRFGVALDAVPSQFCSGELEATILEAYERTEPDVIIIEGQGALSHPAFCTSAFILRGSAPQGVVLQHAPKRQFRCDFERMAMPTPESEIRLIEAFADTRVIGLTINHEHMSDGEIGVAIDAFEKQLGIPVTDALARSDSDLVDMVAAAFPILSEKLFYSTQ